MNGFNPPPGNKGGKITTKTWNRVQDLASRLSKMSVGPGLTMSYVRDTPMIGLTGNLLRSGKTSSVITARVAEQMGTGTVTPYRTMPDGLLVPEGGPDIPVWSKFGVAIPVDVRVIYAVVDDSHELIAGDCSGAD